MTIEIKDMIKIRQKLYQQATVQKSVELTKYNEFAKKVSAEITKRKWQYNKAKTLSKPNWWKEIKDMNSSIHQSNRLEKGQHDKSGF